MPPVTKSVQDTPLDAVTWRKSSHSNPNGNCVELAQTVWGKVAVRNSRHPGGPALIHTSAVMAAFIRAAKEDAFDEVGK